MRITSSVLITLLAVIAPAAFAGSDDPSRTDEDFGNSVRHMINLQIYDLEAARHPLTGPVQGLDGRKVDATLDLYRKDVSRPDNVDVPIEFRSTQ